MWLPWMEFAAVLTVATLLTIPMGKWLARCFTSEHHGWLERLSYRAMGVNPQERMGWQRRDDLFRYSFIRGAGDNA